jgi:hypothetical protein
MVAEPLVPNPPPHRFSHIPPIMEADRGTKGKGKAGKSERMEPYEKPAELSDDTVLTNSPVQKEIVARLRHEQAPGDDQAPAVHSMATPTAQGLTPCGATAGSRPAARLYSRRALQLRHGPAQGCQPGGRGHGEPSRGEDGHH